MKQNCNNINDISIHGNGIMKTNKQITCSILFSHYQKLLVVIKNNKNEKTCYEYKIDFEYHFTNNETKFTYNQDFRDHTGDSKHNQPNVIN